MLQTFEEYLSNAPKFEDEHKWTFPKRNPFRFGKPIDVPDKVKLNSVAYAKLYSLMASEGYTKTEFSIHVPELEFHDLFANCLSELVGSGAVKSICAKPSKGFMRSRAHRGLRHVIPIPTHIPAHILTNKELAREYLRVAFEAEGSAIFDGKSKRYIKLTRNVDVTDLVEGKLNYAEGKRIYLKQLKQDHPELTKELENRPPKLLLGEHLLLKYHFNIDSKIAPEAIRINHTSSGFGKITMRWPLFIYANNIDKFIREIGFLSIKKKSITGRMSKISARRLQYSSFKIISKVQKAGVFRRYDFVKEMRKLGYVSPQTYLWRYVNNGLLKRISYGFYKIISYPLT